jgi:hypothetical protein
MPPKQAASAVIDWLPADASPDEIVDAIWDWGASQSGGAAACDVAANRIALTDVVRLVAAGRGARVAAILGVSRQAALKAVEALPEHPSLEDILVAVTAWRWPDDVD